MIGLDVYKRQGYYRREQGQVGGRVSVWASDSSIVIRSRTLEWRDNEQAVESFC